MVNFQSKLKDATAEKEAESKDLEPLFLSIRVCIIILQITQIYYLISEQTFEGVRNQVYFTVYWIIWALLNVFLTIEWKYNLPLLLRACHHIACIRLIATYFNFQPNAAISDISVDMICECQTRSIGLMLTFFIPFSLLERAIVHIPISCIYQFLLCYGLISSHYKDEVKDQNLYVFVWDYKMGPVIHLTIINIFMQYIPTMIFVYFKTKLHN